MIPVVNISGSFERALFQSYVVSSQELPLHSHSASPEQLLQSENPPNFGDGM